jgi:hypothetical protein
LYPENKHIKDSNARRLFTKKQTAIKITINKNKYGKAREKIVA